MTIKSLDLLCILGVTYSPRAQQPPRSITEAVSPKHLSTLPTKYYTIHTIDLSKPSKPKYLASSRVSDTTEASIIAVNALRIEASLEKPNNTQKHFLCLLNPFGGKKRAQHLYDTLIFPLSVLSNTILTLQVSEFAGHVPNLLRTLDLTPFDGIFTVSGDGLFHELIDGLMQRPDWEVARMMPIGCVGAGTSRAVNKNTDSVDPLVATFAIFKGEVRGMDIIACTQDSRVTFSHLGVEFGLIADIDLESEKLRWMGEMRMNVWAVIRLIFLREYTGSLFYVPVTEDYECKSDGCVELLEYFGPKLKYANEDYKRWTGMHNQNFTMIQACNLPWISDEVLFSKDCRLGNGIMDLFWASELQTTELVGWFLDTASASHIRMDRIKHCSVKAFVLDPGTRLSASDVKAKKKGGSSSSLRLSASDIVRKDIEPGNDTAVGNLGLSGERLKLGLIRVEILERMMSIFTPFWLDEDINVHGESARNKSSREFIDLFE